MNEFENEVSRATILLVDDNEEIIDFISDDLSDKYFILKAFNGEEAIKILDEHAVQLIVSDIMMPVMDGYELCKKVKSNFDYSHIPIILLTAKDTLQSKIQGLEQGADAYIEKPFSPHFLQVQIANLLTNRTMLRDYFAQSPFGHIKSMAHSKADECFLEKLNELILENMTEANLHVDMLADLMNMSRPTLYRKIKAISNLTPNDLINIARLKKAAELLIESNLKMYEVSNIVGYSSQTHFGRNFQKQFGMTPSEYVAKYKQDRPKNP